METEQGSFTKIVLTKDDVTKLVGEHIKDLSPADADIVHGQRQGRFLSVQFPITKQQIDDVLRAMIPNLPPLGKYMGPRLQEDGSAIVRWQTD